MPDHAVIFYVPSRGGYALCYEDDLEQLPEVSKAACPVKVSRPFYITSKAKGKEKGSFMYIKYVKEETKEIVMKMVSVTPEWLNRMVAQFDITFPGGLTDGLVALFGLDPLCDKEAHAKRIEHMRQSGSAKSKVHKDPSRTEGEARILYAE